jgi:NADH-quinone oxidoreductase subunit C
VSEWRNAPGYVSESEAFGELTVTIEPERVRDAAEYARDELGFNLLSDIVATDYLNWGTAGVSGYIGTGSGRDINFPMTQGLQSLPQLKPKRFSVSYHLLALRRPPARVRLQTWVDDGQPLPSVIRVWPGADFFEREQFDMMGIHFDGHPYLRRLLMEDDWEGHPLRKDYPIGGEPVRFSEAE